jgi:pyruvate, orthophosphate dikinase
MSTLTIEEPTTNTRNHIFLFDESAEKHLDGADRPSAAVQNLMRTTLGGKGAGLVLMSACGVNVPPGFTIETEMCRHYYANEGQLPDDFRGLVIEKLTIVEQRLGRKLGDPVNPLFVSVRSGAKISMPGMMDTVLNLGQNDTTVLALAAETGNERFAWDCYRRFIQMYGDVVLGIAKHLFGEILDQIKSRAGVKQDKELSVADLQEVVARYKALYIEVVNVEFPSDVYTQLHTTIEAVFKSWNTERAIKYRKLKDIDHALGTAVTVQSMVFGNMDDEHSATGVCFTRNPSTGENVFYGEYLINAQGEDVVAGIRTPNPIAKLGEEMPQVYEELLETRMRLERFFGDMQDIEFTIQQGRLFILQTRAGARTVASAVRIAVELVAEGLISENEAIRRVDASQLDQLLLPSFDAKEMEAARKAGRLLGNGLAASPGAAQGRIVFDPDEAVTLAEAGERVILVRIETCPDDIHGMHAAQGVLTSRGGMTSHAAVVARGMGKPCVSGCEELVIDLEQGTMKAGGHSLRKGDELSIDGATGEIFVGALPTREADLPPDYHTLLSWADAVRVLNVRTNADTPEDAARARGFGAEGIGLVRTEHMFFDEARLPVVRAMILADSKAGREAELAKLLPMQRDDFIGLFRVMDGLPVTIRLLDPPLHEFLPKWKDLYAEVFALRAQGESDELREKEALLARVEALHEVNPMMGLRGCRLGLLYPEVNVMQVRAIFEAAIAVQQEGIEVDPEIMIPLVGHATELRTAREVLEHVAQGVMDEAGVHVPYKFGTMIEVPRAALIARQLAEDAEFFSFGTNDLTQLTCGLSRDDASSFLRPYQDGVEGLNGERKQILEKDPFVVLDRDGVGVLMRLAVMSGRAARPGMKLGICGEHGGEPNSIAFAAEIGLDYVSCSPFRIGVARLAAAQAQLAIEESQVLEALDRR